MDTIQSLVESTNPWRSLQSDAAKLANKWEKTGLLEGLGEDVNKNNHKSLSFLLHSEHGFRQAPLEEITEEQYNALVASTKLITSIDEANIGLDDDCATGACPVR